MICVTLVRLVWYGYLLLTFIDNFKENTMAVSLAAKYRNVLIAMMLIGGAVGFALLWLVATLA